MFAGMDRPEEFAPLSLELPHESSEKNGLEKAEKYDVLLVEDDTDDRLIALRTLKQSPYINDISFFRNGDELMKYFADEGYYSGNLMRFMPTIVLLDIYMPGTNGIEILKKMKENPATAEIPVVIITADLSGEAAEQARKLKANAFMTKPLNLDRIHEVIFTGWGWPNGEPPKAPAN